MKKRMAVLLVVLFLSFEFFAANILSAQDFNKELYAKRRQEFMSKMDGGIAVFISADGNQDEKFRQDNYFYYLTGFDEPRSAFILIPDAAKKFVMFAREKNPATASWDGDFYGLEAAKEVFGADETFPIDKFNAHVNRYLFRGGKIYYSLDNDDFNKKLIPLFKRRSEAIFNPTRIINELRLFKSPEEIKIMQKAVDITTAAHIEAMKAAEPGINENELGAIIDYVYKTNGSWKYGFPSIIGSGPNSQILHYSANTRKAKDGEVIVMDIGAEYNYYTADITRTIPVNGKFSKEQKDIYKIVLEANTKCLEAVKPGIGIREIQSECDKILAEGLLKLGLITDPKQHRIWTRHGQCHWLGMDVHDVGDYQYNTGKGRPVEPGMVFTMEPGIYISESALDRFKNNTRRRGMTAEEVNEFVEKVRPIVKKYENIGIRIEDDVLVTEAGHLVLSKNCPKTIEDIEKLMKQDSHVNK